MDNAGDLAVGNALGSNLANIGLVLGVTALISPIPIAKTWLKREIPLLLGATIATMFFLYDNHLGIIDGIIFLLMLSGIFYYLVNSKSHQPDAEQIADVEHLPDLAQGKAWWLFCLGLVLLIVAPKLLVWGAGEVALAYGVSELIIGLTVVAVGTSLTELAASAASALKGHHDIAIGNVVGSNLFNLLVVMSMPALLAPASLEPVVFNRIIYPWQGAIISHSDINRHWLAAKQQGPARIGRGDGVLLLLCYLAFLRLFTIHHPDLC